MIEKQQGLLEVPAQFRRVIGRVTGSAEGPTLIVTAGLHGNEPSGVRAAERVLARLAAERLPLAGRLFVLAGNLPALRERIRYVDKDLNREWLPRNVRTRLAGTAEPAVEGAEQLALLEVIREITEGAHGTIYFVDLHTSSAAGPPFVTVGDTLRNRRFAAGIPLPLILGLEEQVDGALLEYLNNFGFVTMGVEAGQHDCPESIDRHEAVLWLTLVRTGLLEESAAFDAGPYRKLLRLAARKIPRIVEVRHRHAITADEEFRMAPGFTNFEPVRRGQIVAHDRTGTIAAPEDGLVLLPLYQGKGNDGFFVARPVRLFWLSLSAVLRRLRLAPLLRFLPGVSAHPDDREILVVDTRVARWYPLEVFHLFGFRKRRTEGPSLLVGRRRYDLGGPRRPTLD